jgi:hypothetical protein
MAAAAELPTPFKIVVDFKSSVRGAYGSLTWCLIAYDSNKRQIFGVSDATGLVRDNKEKYELFVAALAASQYTLTDYQFRRVKELLALAQADAFNFLKTAAVVGAAVASVGAAGLAGGAAAAAKVVAKKAASKAISASVSKVFDNLLDCVNDSSNHEGDHTVEIIFANDSRVMDNGSADSAMSIYKSTRKVATGGTGESTLVRRR